MRAVARALNANLISAPKLPRRKNVREAHFLRMPRFAARLYDWFLQMQPTVAQTRDVARDLAARIDQGRLLDIGTGPGRLLLELHHCSPEIELFGLDISPAMIAVARRNLQGIPVDLRQGRAEQTGLPEDFFDLVTCTGSLYLWDYPEEGLEEIFRILKQGCSAYLFEVYKDVNKEVFRTALRSRLRELDVFRRLIGPFALRKALSIAGRTDEYVAMIKNTSFAKSFTVDKVELGAVPMWLRITLAKPA
jgi:ubiquinone/menaquinone biosynthesis C-methylase UbiE